MAEIVGVHGVAQQYKGPDSLLQEWLPPMRDGVAAAGGAHVGGVLEHQRDQRP